MKRIPLVQLGLGGVGRALVRQIVNNRSLHAARLRLRLEYVALTDRDGLIFDPQGVPDEKLLQIVEAKAQGARLQELEGGRSWTCDPELLEGINGESVIVVDVTASEATVPVLLEARRRDWGVVLANKLPLAGPYEVFEKLASSVKTRFETTVAAALPVISTLQTFLLATGDRVLNIRGCVSGTLNLICERLERGEKFSKIVADAKAHGHTEPDPREDLSGRDAARKALILARLLGHRLELSDVEVEPLYPLDWDSLTVEEFLERLSRLDERFSQLSREAQTQKLKPRYIIEVTGSSCRVGLQRLSPDSELLRPSGADSVVVFETERYRQSPLIVRGKGSGPELTASGVLGDILMVICAPALIS